jgi:hypothetical protein
MSQDVLLTHGALILRVVKWLFAQSSTIEVAEVRNDTDSIESIKSNRPAYGMVTGLLVVEE